MRTSLRRLAALILLVTLFLGVPQGMLVVCVGDAGHIALEIQGDAHASCELPPAAEATCECAHDCGPCTDARLGAATEAALLRDQRSAAVDSSAPATAPAPGTGTLPAVAVNSAPLVAPPPPDRGPRLRLLVAPRN